MFYELRMYHTAPGRLDDLVERIGRVLPPFFDRHGFPPRLGQWTVSAGPAIPMLAWLLCWPGGFDQRTRSFAALGADPEWQAIRQETNGAGEMVRQYDLRFLTPSPAWKRSASSDTLPLQPVESEVFELRVRGIRDPSYVLPPLPHRRRRDNSGRLRKPDWTINTWDFGPARVAELRRKAQRSWLLRGFTGRTVEHGREYPWPLRMHSAGAHALWSPQP